MTDELGARNEIFGAIKAAWDSGSSLVVGYVPEMRYQGVTKEAPPDAAKYWGRASIQTVTEEKTAISGCSPAARYTASGIVFVQVFGPHNDVAWFDKAQRLAVVAKRGLRGKTTNGHVVFRNVRVNELPAEPQFNRFNVVAEFEYDEIG